MAAAFLRFIILGKIPGTDIKLGFGVFLIAALVCALFYVMLWAHPQTTGLVRSINPFYKNRLRPEIYDLISA